MEISSRSSAFHDMLLQLGQQHDAEVAELWARSFEGAAATSVCARSSAQAAELLHVDQSQQFGDDVAVVQEVGAEEVGAEERDWTESVDHELLVMAFDKYARSRGDEASPGAALFGPDLAASEAASEDSAWLQVGSGIGRVSSADTEVGPYGSSEAVFNLRRTWVDRCGTRTSMAPRSWSATASGTPIAFGEKQQRKWERQGTWQGTDYSDCVKRVIIHPNSRTRILWDMLGIVLLLFDIMIIPLQAFELQPNPFLDFMDWFTLIFWTCDMVLSCTTGYVSKGSTIMVPYKILWNYVKTWLILDLVVVGPDWCFVIFKFLGGKSSSGGTSANTLLKTFRVIRISRLLRVARMQRLVATMRDRIASESTFILLNVVRFITMLLLLNHFLATGWYVVGTTSRRLHLANWIDAENFGHESIGYRYATALHWSLTQFTPASMSVQPQNVVERTFAILCLVGGLVLSSCLISSITTSMTQLSNMQDNKSKQFWLLRRYLRHHQVPSQLSFRVLRYIEHQATSEGEEGPPQSKIHILGLLSEQLRNELKYSVSFRCVSTHPLFEKANSVSQVSMAQLSSEALSEKLLAFGDTLFGMGTMATHMYIIESGEIHYSKYEHDEQIELCEGDWLAEPGLWVDAWTHVGNAASTKECKTVCLELLAFGQVIRRDVPTFRVVSEYAKAFLVWLNGQCRDEVSDAFEAFEARPLALQFLSDGKEEWELDYCQQLSTRPSQVRASLFRASSTVSSALS